MLSIKKYQLSHQKGMVTIPFLLVSMILIFLILSFLFLNMTLVHVSITQYMSYSSARRFFLASEAQPDQMVSAKEHYRALRDDFFSPNTYTGRSGDWFDITDQLDDRKIGSGVSGEYPQTGNSDRNRFYGVNLLFETFILKLKIPFLSQGQDTPLQARVSSFLGREPSEDECKTFLEEKYKYLADQCSQTDCPHIKKVEIAPPKPDNGC